MNFVLQSLPGAPAAKDRDLPVERQCVVCGAPFAKRPSERRPVKFCSPECARQRNLEQKRTLGRERGHIYEANTVRTMVTKPCVICGKPFTRNCSVSNVQPTCSKACGLELLSRNNRAKHADKMRCCVVCSKEFKPYRMNRLQKMAGCYQRVCSADCSRQYRAQYGFASHINPMGRAEPVVPTVNPIEVCERDGWKCWWCGDETPRALRGSIEANAPEVDHVIPLSRGGTHSMMNCRCACRACNLIKGDKILPLRVVLAAVVH